MQGGSQKATKSDQSKRYQCSFCDYGSKRKLSVTHHMATAHPDHNDAFHFTSRPRIAKDYVRLFLCLSVAIGKRVLVTMLHWFRPQCLPCLYSLFRSNVSCRHRSKRALEFKRTHQTITQVQRTIYKAQHLGSVYNDWGVSVTTRTEFECWPHNSLHKRHREWRSDI